MSRRSFGYARVATDPTRRSIERRLSMPRSMWPQVCKLPFEASVATYARRGYRFPTSDDVTEERFRLPRNPATLFSDN